MRVEIWFDNNNQNAVMRAFPNIDEGSINKKDNRLYFNSAKSNHRFEINMNHVLFIEYMPGDEK